VAGETSHDLSIRTRVKDLGAKRDLGLLGQVGHRAGQSIAAGFVKAQIALGVMRGLARAVVGAVKSVTVEAVKDIDAIAKAASKAGVSVTWLSEMEHAAKLSGTSMENLVLALRNAARTTAGAGSVEDAFDRAADAIRGAATETERVALAQKLFGRSGTDMLPLLRAGTEGIREMREEAKRLGLSLTAAEAVLGEQASDAMDRFAAAVKGVKRAVAVEFLPSLTAGLNALAKWMGDSREEIVKAVKGVVTWLGKAIVDAFEFVATAVADLADALRGLSVGGALGKDVVQPTARLLAGAGEWAGIVPEGTADLMRQKAAEVGPAGKAVRDFFLRVRAEAEQIAAAIGGRESGPEMLVEAEGPTFLDSFVHGKMNPETGRVEGGMAGGVAELQKTTSAEAMGLATVNSMSSAWGTLFDTIVDGSASAADAVKAFARSVLQDLSRMLMQKALMQILGAVLGTGAQPTAGAAPSGNTGVHEFAAGGIVTRRQLAIVGEAGPEAIIPLRRLRDRGGGMTVNIGDVVVGNAGGDAEGARRAVAAGVADALRNSAALRGMVRRTAREGF
jgi:hypothetical protein